LGRSAEARGSRSHVGLGLLWTGAVRGSRSTGGREIVTSGSRRRIPDESTVLADEHGTGAVFQRREAGAVVVCVSRDQRQQFHSPLSGISERTRGSLG